MSDFIFLHPHWLIGLLPVAAVLIWLLTRSQHQTLIAPHLAKAMGLENKADPALKLTLVTLGWALAIIALAGPSFEKQTLPTFSNSNARVLVMDMSRSMYATDNKPNRLTQARYKAMDLLKRWTDGYTGLIAYAADAYTISPLTDDTATITNLLPDLSPAIMPYQGADAAKAVQAAIKMLKDSGNGSGDIVLITDDIDKHEQSGIESLLQGSNWHLSILGMGSQSGAPIQLSDGSLLQDRQGNTVIAHAHFDRMRALANAVNGLFTPMQLDNRDVNMITKETQSHLLGHSHQQKQKIKSRINNGYFLLPFILIPAVMLFRKGLIFALLLTCYTLLPTQRVYASPWLNQNQQAKQAYDAKHFKQAAKLFTDPAWKGAAQYQAGDYQGAIQSYSQIQHPTTDQQYNLANAYAQHQQFQKAIDLYKQVLKQQPNDVDAQHNLKQVEKALKKQQQQNQHNKQQNQKNQKNQKNNQQNHQDKASSNASNNKQQSENNQAKTSSDKHNQSDQQKQNSHQQSKQNSASDHQSSSQQQKNAKNNPSSKSQDNAASDKSKSQSKHQASPSDQMKNRQQHNASQAQSTPSQSEQHQPKHQQQQAKSARAMAQRQQDNNAKADPELRKLEQVENARDPSQLLRAQILLQAERRSQPDSNGKEW